MKNFRCVRELLLKKREREKGGGVRQTNRQRERERQRERDAERDRERERETETEREREAERQTDRQTNRQTERRREKGGKSKRRSRCRDSDSGRRVSIRGEYHSDIMQRLRSDSVARMPPASNCPSTLDPAGVSSGLLQRGRKMAKQTKPI